MNKTFIKKFFRVFLMTFVIGGILSALISCVVIYGLVSTVHRIDTEMLTLNFTTSLVYIDTETGEEKELEKLYDEQNRVWAEMSKMPEYLPKAFIAIEDERYYKHMGFDIPRTTKAIFNYIFKGDKSFGGSTITQQLVKNVSGEKDTTPQRKVMEIFRAVELNSRISKDEILELYLNTIYLGNGCNGVQTASKTYFEKDVSELTLAQSASIAGITQFPSLYDPFVNPEKNNEKKQIVLKKMLDLKMITKEEYDIAVNEQLVFKNPRREKSSVQSYFTDQVIEDVIRDLTNKKGYSKSIAQRLVYTGGLKIYTTVDTRIQNIMEEIYENDANFPKFSSEIQPESAMVVLDPYTGAIKGIVGGRGEKAGYRVLNRASQSLRQPGSTMKPIGVYAPGFEYGRFTPSTVFIDEVYTVAGHTFKNYYSGYRGSMTVRKAIEDSVNVVAVKALEKVKIDTSFNFLTENLGITSLVARDKRADGKTYTDKTLSALALGGVTDGISVLEMAAAYGPFVNSGIYTKPYSYTKVLDHSGNTILDNQKESRVAMSEQTAYMMLQMLVGVCTNGTGTGARISGGMPTGGKTGTTDDDKDRWFIGVTPYYVGAVWLGFDTPKSLAGLGSNPTVSIFKKVMDKVHANVSAKSFKQPIGITNIDICSDSGLPASPLCYEDERGSRVRSGLYARNMIPSGICDLHKEIRICTESKMLATENCPEETVITVVATDELYHQPCDIHLAPLNPTPVPSVAPSPTILASPSPKSSTPTPSPAVTSSAP